MNTPTPRTDAKYESICESWENKITDFPKMTDFARTLERELTAVTEQRDILAEALERIANNNIQDTQQTDYAYELGRMEGIAKIALQSLTQNDERTHGARKESL